MTDPADKSPTVEPAGKSPFVEEPGSSPNGASGPAFGAWEPEEAGPPPEALVGAAFVGGLALAFVIKRLGR